MPVMSQEKLESLRAQLRQDAQQAKMNAQNGHRTDWIAPETWSKYTGPSGRQLYRSFSDDDLLDMIREEAAVLGRVPAQREVFCVYRDYILRRFGNWIKALQAAGLREPKKKADAG